MIDEAFQEKIKTALTSELISYVAGYRALGLNKEQSIACMLELDKRHQDGDTTDYRKEIDNQAEVMKSIGSGFVVIAIPGVQLDELRDRIRESGTYCMITNRNDGIIHIGKPDLFEQTKISKLVGVKEVVSDKKVIANVAGSTVSS